MTDPIPALPPLDVEAIKARAAAATKGPWISDGADEPDVSVIPSGQAVARVFSGQAVRVSEMGRLRSLRRANAEFIAHARQDIPALLAEVDRLRALVPSPQPRLEYFARSVLKAFEESEATGYRSKDRQFAIELLRKGLEPVPSPQPATPTGSPDNVIDCHCPTCGAALPAIQDEAPKAEEWLASCGLARGWQELDSQPILERCVRRILASCSGKELIETFVKFAAALGASRPSRADTKEEKS